MGDVCRPALPNPRHKDEVDAHVAAFERWFLNRQKEAGLEAGPLISVEHAIVRSYISWLRDHADDQAV